MTEFDEQYYLEYCQERGSYNVLRPVRRALIGNYWFLPPDASVVVFGFDNVDYYARWRSRFKNVIGYDINPYLIRLAQEKGLPVYEQDLTVPFEPKGKGNACVCYFLLEHLTDAQCAQVARNMIAHAPINIIQVTDVDDPHFALDPTHTNAKTAREWRSLLDSVYQKARWVRFHARKAAWGYAPPQYAEAIRSMEGQIAYLVAREWARL